MSDLTIHSLESAPADSREHLAASEKSFGFIPGLHRVMAEAPALLDGYKHLHNLFQTQTSFTNDELTVVWQTVNVEHNCHYCVPAHTGIAKAMKVDDAITNALRDETPLPDARLEALRAFTLRVVRGRGDMTEADVRAFLNAGFTKRQVLEVILGVAQKVMSNYTNHLAETPVDDTFKAYIWEKRTADAA
jgi:alkylhydroperoxidase family enzyme